MYYKNPDKNSYLFVKLTLYFLVFFYSCTTIKHAPDKPFVFSSKIGDIKGGDFTRDERAALKQRLYTQLDDSSKVTRVDKLLLFRTIKNPPVYDSAYSVISAQNISTSMQFIGYFNNKVSVNTDTVKINNQQRVYVTYNVETGIPTRIDTISYRLKKQELQDLAMQTKDESLLKAGDPVTKQNVVGEKSRLISLYRNNGYYKFSADELRVIGDTTIEALTNIDDPFEALRLLQEAQQKRDSPTIKLAVALNMPKAQDSNRIAKYYINRITILPDYQPYDSLSDVSLTRTIYRDDSVLYHRPIFKNRFLVRNLYLKAGDVYNQDNFFKTLNSFSQKGVWQSVNILTSEVKDSNKLNLIVQLIPGLKNTIEGNIEASIGTSNVNNISSTNLFGLSGNIGWTTRNVGREAIQMTNKIGGGIEFSKNKNSGRNTIINSRELNFANSLSFPKLIEPYKKLVRTFTKPKNRNKENFISRKSFISTNLSYVNRINLFDLQTINFAPGFNVTTKRNYQWIIKAPNIEFTNLYHQTDSFNKILDQNPFLRYSFRTALVVSAAVSFRSDYFPVKHPTSQRTLKLNVEVPILPAGIKNVTSGDNIFRKYLRLFVKPDAEYIYTVRYPKAKAERVLRAFVGVGIPISRADSTLPFFKQYYGGGSNSMRGWPVRGIGRGSQPLKPFDNTNGFNDRTGDIQFEANAEYRKTIAQIIPNSILLRMSLFTDWGNVWNFKNSKATGIDSTQFKFRNFYKELGVDAGAGLSVDFTYFVLRFDYAFRFKRPDISANNGWQFPSINLKNLFGREGKAWRYENANFTIGLGYAFK